MNEIIKYHNDFNKIKLPSFTEQEQNILFGIFSKIRDKPSGSHIRFEAQELKNFSEKNLDKCDLDNIILTLKHKFFKADFTILVHDKDSKGRELIGEKTINLFKDMIIYYVKDNPDDGNDYSKNFSSLILSVNPEFEYLVNQLTANFTRFELAEFITLNGKYTKTLYRLLKQFRHTGNLTKNWQEFIHIMDIPKTYQMSDIDKQILKPAMRELTKEHTLFDTKRIPFKNLSYKKIKQGGNKVVKIEFSFAPEPMYKDMQIPKMTKKESLIETLSKNFVNKYIYSNNLNEIVKIESFNISEKDNKIIMVHFYSDKEEKALECGYSLKQYTENDILIMFQNAIVKAKEIKKNKQ